MIPQSISEVFILFAFVFLFLGCYAGIIRALVKVKARREEQMLKDFERENP